MKAMTIKLDDLEMARYRALPPQQNVAWKFWKGIFGTHPMLRNTPLNGLNGKFPTIRWVGGNEFRIEPTERKLSERAIKAVKALEGKWAQ